MNALKNRTDRNKNYIFYLIMVIALFLISNAYSETELYSKMDLYSYTNKDIQKFLKKHNYKDFHVDEVRRNSIGTKLYLYNYYRTDKKNIVLCISEKKAIKQINTIGEKAYFNENGEIVAWYDDIKKGILFKDGSRRKSKMLGSVFSSFDVDLSGEYYFLKIEPNLAEIATTAAPNKILFTVKIEVDKLFVCDGRIYIFGRNFKMAEKLYVLEEYQIICQIFKKTADNYAFEEEIIIPRSSPKPSPFSVVDMDLTSERVLLLDIRDNPTAFLSSWYDFNLKTKKMTRIGRAKDFGFFLRGDVIKK